MVHFRDQKKDLSKSKIRSRKTFTICSLFCYLTALCLDSSVAFNGTSSLLQYPQCEGPITEDVLFTNGVYGELKPKPLLTKSPNPITEEHLTEVLMNVRGIGRPCKNLLNLSLPKSNVDSEPHPSESAAEHQLSEKDGYSLPALGEQDPPEIIAENMKGDND